ncbi:MAG: substrate-binding domain-containing protein, partial [Myxococcota bacterium]
RFGRDLLRQVEGFEARLTGRKEHQPVVLAAGVGAWLYLLGPAIEAFQRETPQVPLKLWTRMGPQAVAAVRSGEAHVGVTSIGGDEVMADADLKVEILAKVPHVLLLPDDHPLAAQTALEASALEGAALVVPPRGRPLREALEAFRPTARWTVAVEASGWPLMLHFVGLGLGWAVVNGFCPPPAGFVKRPLLDLPERVYLVVRRRELRDATVDRLITLLTEPLLNRPMSR